MENQSQDIPSSQLRVYQCCLKTATEAMYAQGEQGQADAQPQVLKEMMFQM
jgi:molecular chaperone DnaK